LIISFCIREICDLVYESIKRIGVFVCYVQSAYDKIKAELENQKCYTDKSGDRLYVFKSLSFNSFIFTARVDNSELGDFEVQLEGLHELLPVPRRLRKRTLRRFGVEEKIVH